ncbi:MAG: hypothetical protein ACYTDY_20155, partial [Planctomycetota bacterium]
ELRQRAGRLLVDVAAHLERGGLAITDRDGKITTFGDLSSRFLGLPLAANASVALAAFRLSALAGGPPEHAARYEDLVRRGYARSASYAKVTLLDVANRSNELMATAGLYHLAALESDPEVRGLYARGLARVAAGVRGEGNALFLGYHLATSGLDPTLAEEACRSLMLLPVVPEDWPERIPATIVGVVPHDLRPDTALVWRSDPRKAARKPRSERTREYAPVDYLVAYWLLRAHGLVPPCTES